MLPGMRGSCRRCSRPESKIENLKSKMECHPLARLSAAICSITFSSRRKSTGFVR